MKNHQRYNKYTLQTNCRICLTQGINKSVSLKQSLKSESLKPLIYEAIEFITNEKVPLSCNYPGALCGMCYELLKIAYDLIVQYRTSQEALQEKFEASKDVMISYVKETQLKEMPLADASTPTATVEIVMGEQRFSIRDLLIIEDKKKHKTSWFEGFLNNLGTSVSAFFVSKNYQTPKLIVDPPSVVLEKIAFDQTKFDNITKPIGTTVMPFEETLSEQVKEVIIDDLIKVDTAPFVIPTTLDDVKDIDNDAIKLAMKMKYRCPYCKKPLCSQTRAKIHMAQCRQNTINVICHVCGTKFSDRKSLIKHINRSHLLNLPNSITALEVPYTCQICHKVSHSSSALSYHMVKHGDRKYQCEECGKQFFTSTHLKSHMQSHQKGTAIVICPVCGKSFHYQNALHYHMKIHQKQRDIQCRYCPRRFYARTSAKRHELTHTGLRPYTCKYCDKAFRSIGEVRKHEYLHTGERPYRCNYCEMAFTETYNLKVHLTTHAGEFRCAHCYRGFVEMEVLTFHMKQKHRFEESLDTVKEEEKREEDQVTTEIPAAEEEVEQVYFDTEQLENYYVNDKYCFDGNGDAVILDTFDELME
ncbi:uncharacterized protein [Euwallacea fornicatus]|uniref:uncharacterized protein n=1 Tax=Euwallacea fornicatus TaxID=995702 RepID=UPI00338E9472